MLQEKLCALVELLELQPGELAQVLRRSPSLLNRDVESLRPQLRTLLHHLRDPDLVSSVVRSYSQVLAPSQPRSLFLVDRAALLNVAVAVVMSRFSVIERCLVRNATGPTCDVVLFCDAAEAVSAEL